MVKMRIIVETQSERTHRFQVSVKQCSNSVTCGRQVDEADVWESVKSGDLEATLRARFPRSAEHGRHKPGCKEMPLKGRED